MNFVNLVTSVLNEDLMAGGPSSVYGPAVGSTASAFSGDTYNTGDMRIAKSIYGGVITRKGMKSRKNKNRKRKK